MRRNYVSGWDISLPSRRRQGAKKHQPQQRLFPTVNFSTTALAAPFPPSLFTACCVYACHRSAGGRAGWKERYRKRARRSRWYLWWWLVCSLFANFILRHNAAPESRDASVYATGSTTGKEKIRSSPICYFSFSRHLHGWHSVAFPRMQPCN